MANVSVVVVSHNRPTDLQRCVRSIVTQGGGTTEIIVVDNFSDAGLWPVLPQRVQVIRTDAMLGPADAKNIGFKQVTSPFAVLLDDDAELVGHDALERVLRIFSSRPDIACLALNCTGHWMDLPPVEQMALLPHRWNRNDAVMVGADRLWPSAEFIGAGCAFSTDAFRSAGGFPRGYGYGFEEPHLAYRLLDAGGTILYARDIVVLHHHSTAWRLPDPIRIASEASNKCALVAELMPVERIPQAIVPFALRMAARGIRQRVAPGQILHSMWRGVAAGWQNRSPLKPATVASILSLRGRL